MIGQVNLKRIIESLIKNDTFPRFCILVGDKGSGKKTMVNYIRSQFNNILFADVGTGVEAVRDIISNAYKVGAPTMYLIPDADGMSVQAKNALLKITEEPPNNAYIIMTLEDINNTLDTIRSRAAVLFMDRYTPKEIYEYAAAKEIDEKGKHIIESICETPGEVNIFAETGVSSFYEYVEKVVGNIATVNGANVFKIADKVALKEDAEGYDLKMFWKTFIYICSLHYVSNSSRQYLQAMLITSSALQKLRIKGVNRQAVFDSWILDIRKEWM